MSYLRKSRSSTHCYHDVDDRDIVSVSFPHFMHTSSS